MADMQAGAGWVCEHVENVEFGRKPLEISHLSRKSMTHPERVSFRDGIAGVKSAERLLVVPILTPFGFNQVKRILSASGCHNRGILRKAQMETTPELPTRTKAARKGMSD